jgi:hypothetical protein
MFKQAMVDMSAWRITFLGLPLSSRFSQSFRKVSSAKDAGDLWWRDGLLQHQTSPHILWLEQSLLSNPGQRDCAEVSNVSNIGWRVQLAEQGTETRIPPISNTTNKTSHNMNQYEPRLAGGNHHTEWLDKTRIT